MTSRATGSKRVDRGSSLRFVLVACAIALLSLWPSAAHAQRTNVLIIRFPSEEQILAGFRLQRPQNVWANDNPASQGIRGLRVSYPGNLEVIGFLINGNHHTFRTGPNYQRPQQIIDYTKYVRTGCNEGQMQPFFTPASGTVAIEFNALIELETWWSLCRRIDPRVEGVRKVIRYFYCKRRATLVGRRILRWGDEPLGLEQGPCIVAIRAGMPSSSPAA